MSEKLKRKSVERSQSERMKVVNYNTRIAVLGSDGAGKTSIISTFVKCESVLTHNMPAKGLTNALFHDGSKIVAMEMIDHSIKSCQHSALDYNAITTCDAFILLFTVGNTKSFEEVEAFRHELMHRRNDGRIPVIAVMGNKLDVLEESQMCEKLKAELTVTCDWGHPYFETSLHQTKEIEQCFRQVVEISLRESGQLLNTDASEDHTTRRASCPKSLLNTRRKLSKLLRIQSRIPESRT